MWYCTFDSPSDVTIFIIINEKYYTLQTFKKNNIRMYILSSVLHYKKPGFRDYVYLSAGV